MGEFSHYAMQVAVHDLLVADLPLMNAVSGVYDYVPPQTAYPYITIGDMRATDVSTISIALTRMELALHVYSRGRGRKEISDIMAQLYALLHDAKLLMEEYITVTMRYVSSEIAQERDGLTYHGRMRFSAVLERA